MVWISLWRWPGRRLSRGANVVGKHRGAFPRHVQIAFVFHYAVEQRQKLLRRDQSLLVARRLQLQQRILHAQLVVFDGALQLDIPALGFRDALKPVEQRLRVWV